MYVESDQFFSINSLTSNRNSKGDEIQLAISPGGMPDFLTTDQESGGQRKNRVDAKQTLQSNCGGDAGTCCHYTIYGINRPPVILPPFFLLSLFPLHSPTRCHRRPSVPPPCPYVHGTLPPLWIAAPVLSCLHAL